MTDLQLEAVRGPVAAVLFTQGVMVSMDVMSALNSSPWTSENFGADPEKAKTSREYVTHSIVVSTAIGVTSALVGKSWWPIFGTLATNGYLWWIYDRALARGATAGSEGWANQ